MINKASSLLAKLDMAVDMLEEESHGEWVKLPSPAFTNFMNVTNEIDEFVERNIPYVSGDTNVWDALQYLSKKRIGQLKKDAAGVLASLALSLFERLYNSEFDFIAVDVIMFAFSVLNMLSDEAD